MSSPHPETAAPPTSNTPDTNGVHPASGGEDQAPCSAAASSQGSCSGNRVDRAEQLVERVAEKVSSLTARWGRGLVGVFGRLREEAQDFWGEVQSIRRGDQR